MKIPSTILASILAFPLFADTVYTIPQGYTKITIGEASNGATKTTAFSVTLLNDTAFASAGAINADFNPDPDGNTSTNVSSQTILSAGASWSPLQWTTEPHLIYLTNADGAEEPFLISSHTTDTITINVGYDILGDSDPSVAIVPKFPSATQLKIRKANTLESIFGASGALLSGSDRVFVWNGSEWETFRYATFWRNLNALGTNANGAVVFPEEGIFVLRTQASDVTLTLFGEVPSAPQISTVVGSGFISSRYPVETTIEQVGAQLSNWQSNDRLFVWNSENDAWSTYRFVTFWRNLDALATNANADILDANSAVFVTREIETSGAQGGITSPLPYNPFTQ